MKINQYKTGVVLSYLSIIISTLYGIIITPFMLRHLGQSEYGLYALIGSFVGYLWILDFGINNAIVRYIAKYRTEQNKFAEENFLGIAILIYSIIAILILVIGIITLFNLDLIFQKSLTEIELRRAKIMFLILLFNVAITLPGSSFSGILNGYEKFVFPRILNISRFIFRAGLVLAILFLGGKSIAIVILDTIINAIVILVNVIYVIQVLKVKIKLHFFDKPLIKEVMFYSFWVFLNMIADQLLFRSGQVILGIMIGTVAVAIFAIGMQFIQYYLSFSTAISSLFLPNATTLITKNVSNEMITAQMLKVGRIQFIILGFALAGFILLGNEFVILWAGQEYSVAYKLGLILLIPLTFPLIQSYGDAILQAKNKHAFRSYVLIIVSILGIGVGVILTASYGIIGLTIGLSSTVVFGRFLIINWYYHYRIGINIPSFFKGFKNLFLSFILCLIMGYVLNHFGELNWLLFTIKGFIFSIIYFLLTWHVGMNSFEKSLIASPFYKALNRIKRKKR